MENNYTKIEPKIFINLFKIANTNLEFEMNICYYNNQLNKESQLNLLTVLLIV